MRPELGRHLLAELYGVPAPLLRDARLIARTLRAAAIAAGATPIGRARMHRFPAPGGVTGVLLLTESHVAVHTWPERESCTIDAFTCGEAEPRDVVRVFREALRPARVRTRLLSR